MDDIQIIKDKIDVVELIREYVQLKPAGVNQKGLCPFHHEKSPSFMASSERQSWHCFGCNKGGDIFSFVQEIEGMDFVESLKFLANKAGVQLSNRSGEKTGNKKSVIKEINGAAASFFHSMLVQMDVSKSARDYLAGRGLFQKTIDDWNIGYIPDQWDLLTKYLLKKGYGIDDLVDAGLTIRRDGAEQSTGRGFYDRFRGRIMFPITDVHGAVVGFTGRVLVETEKSGGKYVNTPQTIVYDKSRIIFGLHQARQAIRTQDCIVMVEGQMDVISSHQAGITNVVASSGTALTEDQVVLLKRYSDNINVAFDADDAGQKAAKRGIDIALQKGMRVRVIRIPDGSGKDPDECVKKDPAIWKGAIQGAQDIMEWYVDKACKERDIQNPSQKQAIVEEILPEVANIPYAVERDHWLNVVAERIRVSTDVLREDLKRVQSQMKQKKQVGSTQENDTQPSSKKELEPRRKTRIDMLQDRLFALFLKFPGVFEGQWWKGCEDSLSTGDYAELYENIKDQYTKDGSFTRELFKASKDFSHIFDMAIMQADLLFADTRVQDAETESKAVIGRIKDEWNKMRRMQIQKDIEQAERAGDGNRVQELLQIFQTLT